MTMQGTLIILRGEYSIICGGIFLASKMVIFSLQNKKGTTGDQIVRELR